jgi:sugar phosphate isomerase/epimerase
LARITACSTLVYTTATLTEAVERISRRGFSRVELAHMGAYCTHYPPGQDPLAVKDLLARNNLTPIAINSFPAHVFPEAPSARRLDIADIARRYETHMQSFLEEMHQVGVPLVLALVGFRNPDPDREQQVASAAALTSRLGERARGLGIKLALELPHCYSICHRLGQTKDLFDRIESDNVGAVFDATHQQVIGYTPEEYLDLLGDRICHVHLRDAAGRDTGDFRQKLELTPGKGEVDFRRIARALDTFGYHGEVTLELEYQGWRLEGIDPEVDAGIAYLQECGWELPEGVRVSK